MRLEFDVRDEHIKSLKSVGVDPQCAIHLIFHNLNYHIKKEQQGYDIFKSENIEEILVNLIESCRKLKEEQIAAARKGSIAIEDLKTRRDSEKGKISKN